MPLLGEKKFDVINQSKPRIDGVDKVTGKARYAADIYMDGMLIAGVLRSPYTSAKVTRIDASKARAIEGVAAVVTFEDMHLSESVYEPNWTREHLGKTPVEYYNEIGYLGKNVFASQCVKVSESELDLLAASGTRAITMTRSRRRFRTAGCTAGERPI